MGQSRLRDLDRQQDGRALVLRWLTEAHRFPTLPRYCQWLLGQPWSSWPLLTVPERATAAARKRLGSASRAEIKAARRAATAEATFLIELVLIGNALAYDARQRLSPEIDRLAALLSTCDFERTLLELGLLDPELSALAAQRRLSVREEIAAITLEIAAIEGAHRILGRRYLQGRELRFPQETAAWREISERCGAIGQLALEILGTDGASGTGGDNPSAAATDTRAAARATLIATAAHAAVLGLFDDARALQPIARRARAPCRSRPTAGA